MKNFTLLLCLAIGGLTTTAQTIQWQKLLGGTGNDQFLNLKTQQTSDGGYIVVGNTIEAGGRGPGTGTLTGLTNNGSFDGWVVKLDASGNTTWQKLLGGSSDDRLYGVQQTADGGYIAIGYSLSSNNGTLTGITGNGNVDGWIVKLDANGNTTWQKLFGGQSDDYFFGISQTSDGGYIVTGQANSSNSGTLTGSTNNGGAFDGWVIKMDATGTIIWQKLLGGNSVDVFREVRQTTDGGYITAGYSTSSNTGTLTGVINNGAEDGWIVKLDAAGNTTWQKLLGGDGTDYLTPIQQTSDGGYITALASKSSSNTGTLTGLTNHGDFDGWVIKLDASGNTTWQKLLGGDNDDEFYGCRQTNDGGYVLAGYTRSSNTGTLTGFTNHGNYDGWFVILDAAGNTKTQQLLGGDDDDRFYTIGQTLDGGTILEGYSATPDGSGTFTGIAFNGGAFDGWVLKLNPSVLPVTLLNLGAKYIAANNIEVSWQTSSEQNNKGFKVYRSTDGINFSQIGFVAGAINSNRLLHYNFSDNSAIKGKVFYRLKQIDEEGNGKFSSIVYVIISKQNVITFSPNPVKNFFTIVSSNNIKEIKLVNTNGQLVKKWNNISQDAKLDIGAISKGVYFIKFINEDFVETQKLMKE